MNVTMAFPYCHLHGTWVVDAFDAIPPDISGPIDVTQRWRWIWDGHQVRNGKQIRMNMAKLCSLSSELEIS